jgi:CheY-like chemotaxis protein
MVDDFPGILEILRRYLSSKCEAVTEKAMSGADALNKLQEQDFDIIISDFDMREMNGIELLQAVRKSGNTIPFILLTGVTDPGIETEALKYGAVYMQKGELPTRQFDEILAIIEKIKK